MKHPSLSALSRPRARARRADRGGSSVEPLETRVLFAAATPTDFEQYELQLLNRARANPTAEVTRLSSLTWGDDPSQVPGTAYPQPQPAALNEGLPANTISTAAKQPLAFNTLLIGESRDYSQTLLNNNDFQHFYGGTTPQSRMQAGGYVFTPTPSGSGENLAVTASTGAYPITTAVAAQHHSNLFVDNNVTGRGHRTNMMDPSWREVGIGLAQRNGYTYFGSAYNAVLTTQDFAYTAGNPFLTGVAFNDVVTADNFYTPGEGLGGLTISATPVGGGSALTATTWSSGGYSLRAPAGTYNVTASGAGLSSPVTMSNVVVGSLNVEVDFRPQTAAPLPSGVTASAGAAYAYDATAKTLSLTSGTLTFGADVNAATPGLSVTANGAASSIVFNTTQHLASLTLTNGATATVTHTSAGTAGRVLVLNTLSVPAPGAANGGGKLDLNNNSLILNYAAGQGAAALTAVTALAKTGYNAGNWQGTGLTSGDASTAATTSTATALGVVDNGVAGFASFAGETGLTGRQVLVGYTVAGDATLDATANIADFAKLQNHFNASGTWLDGDFNYDGVVNIADFAVLQNNFNKNTPAPAVGASASASAALSASTSQPTTAARQPVQRVANVRPHLRKPAPARR